MRGRLWGCLCGAITSGWVITARRAGAVVGAAWLARSRVRSEWVQRDRRALLQQAVWIRRSGAPHADDGADRPGMCKERGRVRAASQRRVEEGGAAAGYDECECVSGPW